MGFMLLVVLKCASNKTTSSRDFDVLFFFKHGVQERLGWDPLQRYISDLNHLTRLLLDLRSQSLVLLGLHWHGFLIDNS